MFIFKFLNLKLQIVFSNKKQIIVNVPDYGKFFGRMKILDKKEFGIKTKFGPKKEGVGLT